MTVEELLKPRIKIIAPWPDMGRYNFAEGDILTDDIKDAVRNQYGDACFAVDWDEYPHLFKRLEWHQERDKKDMPQYIKWTHPGTKEVDYFKVEQWLSDSAGIYTAHVYDPAAYLFIRDIEPATEQEYTDYINSKVK